MHQTERSNRNFPRLLIVCCPVFLAIGTGISDAVKAEDTTQVFERFVAERTTLLRDDAIVTWGAAAAPVGRFLLIRKNSALCAVLFTRFRRGGDASRQTSFNSGEEHRHAEYDWYFQEDGSGDFMRENAKHGHDTVVSGPLVGIGRLAFQTGKTEISCGPFKLFWHYPDLVDIFPGNKPGDYGIEMAPTSWSDLSEISAAAPGLKWFRVDESRKPMIIPVSDLK